MLSLLAETIKSKPGFAVCPAKEAITGLSEAGQTKRHDSRKVDPTGFKGYVGTQFVFFKPASFLQGVQADQKNVPGKSRGTHVRRIAHPDIA